MSKKFWKKPFFWLFFYCLYRQKFTTMSSNTFPPPIIEQPLSDELSDNSNDSDVQINQLFSNAAKKVDEKTNKLVDDASEGTIGTFSFELIVLSSKKRKKSLNNQSNCAKQLSVIAVGDSYKQLTSNEDTIEKCFTVSKTINNIGTTRD